MTWNNLLGVSLVAVVILAGCGGGGSGGGLSSVEGTWTQACANTTASDGTRGSTTSALQFDGNGGLNQLTAVYLNFGCASATQISVIRIPGTYSISGNQLTYSYSSGSNYYITVSSQQVANVYNASHYGNVTNWVPNVEQSVSSFAFSRYISSLSKYGGSYSINGNTLTLGSTTLTRTN